MGQNTTEKAAIILDDIMETIYHAAKIMSFPHDELDIEQKAPHDYVTEKDRAVQAYLIDKLGQKYPNVHFIAEEQTNDEFRRKIDEGSFIIDPIDGTLNYMVDIPLCCISVAYAEEGQVLCGAVFNPYMDEMFSAVIGQGAYLNEKRIHCKKRDLDHAALLCEYGWRADFHKIKNHMMSFRVIGSAALAICWLAAGRAGVYVSSVARSWDVAAASLIAKESGLEVLDLNGKEYGLRDSGTVVSCCKEDTKAVIAMIDDCMDRQSKRDRGDWL